MVPPPGAWARLAQRPLLVTVRDAAEGGKRRLTTLERRQMFLEFLPRASWIDVEIASLKALREVVAAARAGGVGLVASFHDFHGTPTRRKFRSLADRAIGEKAAVLKIATRTDDALALARLLEFIGTETRIPVSVMGMGRLGRASRLSLAAAGSILNYVSLGPPAAPGQWPADLFRRRLAELR